MNTPHTPYQAFLFDMDGTLLTSIAAAERVWTRWAHQHGLDAESFVPTIHGARAVDTIAKLQLPGVDPVAEAAWITREEIADVQGVTAIAGAPDFLRQLPPERWAIVTSAPAALAARRLQAAGFIPPPILVSADDVVHGKPDPSGYLLAAQRLGVAINQCLIFEDAGVGIQAAEAAGASVLVITATHTHSLATRHACVTDFQALRPRHGPGGITLDGVP
ncbi:MAG: HAD-IA family hydrolase [Pseudoxanthomonas sp.]